ncbi:protein of unknown function [Candidatus Methylomirabilis oxygeniifera]|uniref:Uncharacterized protein n=1 Tax=Methylomirabilis oxygeniifera TaxID=671143 RepID=D5MKX3_METO1|nr:protein of unknown function [Candidatus Methylomirabilis oxyfera]
MMEDQLSRASVEGGEAKVNVGNNTLEVYERGRIEIRLAGFHGVTRGKVSGTCFCRPHAIRGMAARRVIPCGRQIGGK